MLEAPPDPVSTHCRHGGPSVPTSQRRNAKRTSGDAPGGSAAPHGTQCCGIGDGGCLEHPPTHVLTDQCSLSAIRSDRARSGSDDASWRRPSGSAESAPERARGPSRVKKLVELRLHLLQCSVCWTDGSSGARRQRVQTRWRGRNSTRQPVCPGGVGGWAQCGSRHRLPRQYWHNVG